MTADGHRASPFEETKERKGEIVTGAASLRGFPMDIFTVSENFEQPVKNLRKFCKPCEFLQTVIYARQETRQAYITV